LQVALLGKWGTDLSKDSLIKGTVILAAAAFIARFLGVVQRVPLQNMLGDIGMATYGIAYNVYALLLIVATAGIPSALSKLVSEKLALGRTDEAARIYRAAVWFAITTGLLMTAVLALGAPYYAVHIAKDADATIAIQALAPAMLLFPLIAIMRGYFQGRQTMLAGGLSQIFEQVLRVGTAVGLAYVILQLGYDIEWAVAGASFGGVTGALAAFGVMLVFQLRLRKRTALAERGTASPSGDRIRRRDIYRMLFRLSIPISLISMAVPMIYFIDSSIVIPLLEPWTGYDQAKETLGILTGRAQSLAGIPPILAIALSMSIVPIVSSAYARHDLLEVAAKTSQALRIAILSGLPVILALCVAARPINQLLYGDASGTGIIAFLTAGSLFQIMMMTSAAVLMGLGQTKRPVMYVTAGLAVKLAFSFLLVKPLGIYGILVATTLCFVTTMSLNMLDLRRTVRYQLLGRRWLGLLATTVIIVAVGISLESALHSLGAWFTPRWNGLLHAAIIGCAAVAMYPVFMLTLGGIRPEDVRHFPAPVRKLLGKWVKNQEGGRAM